MSIIAIICSCFQLLIKLFLSFVDLEISLINMCDEVKGSLMIVCSHVNGHDSVGKYFLQVEKIRGLIRLAQTLFPNCCSQQQIYLRS